MLTERTQKEIAESIIRVRALYSHGGEFAARLLLDELRLQWPGNVELEQAYEQLFEPERATKREQEAAKREALAGQEISIACKQVEQLITDRNLPEAFSVLNRAIEKHPDRAEFRELQRRLRDSERHEHEEQARVFANKRASREAGELLACGDLRGARALLETCATSPPDDSLRGLLHRLETAERTVERERENVRALMKQGLVSHARGALTSLERNFPLLAPFEEEEGLRSLERTLSEKIRTAHELLVSGNLEAARAELSATLLRFPGQPGLESDMRALEAAEEELRSRQEEIRTLISRGEFNRARYLLDELLLQFLHSPAVKNQLDELDSRERQVQEAITSRKQFESFLSAGDLAAAREILERKFPWKEDDIEAVELWQRLEALEHAAEQREFDIHSRLQAVETSIEAGKWDDAHAGIMEFRELYQDSAKIDALDRQLIELEHQAQERDAAAARELATREAAAQEAAAREAAAQEAAAREAAAQEAAAREAAEREEVAAREAAAREASAKEAAAREVAAREAAESEVAAKEAAAQEIAAREAVARKAAAQEAATREIAAKQAAARLAAQKRADETDPANSSRTSADQIIFSDPAPAPQASREFYYVALGMFIALVAVAIVGGALYYWNRNIPAQPVQAHRSAQPSVSPAPSPLPESSPTPVTSTPPAPIDATSNSKTSQPKSVTPKSASDLVRKVLPPTITFEADRSQIGSGESVTLRWTVTNVVSVEVFPSIGAITVENGHATGERVVAPTDTTNYRLIAKGAGSLVADSLVTVEVARPVRILSFTATPQKAALKGEVALAWETQGATDITLELSSAPKSSLASLSIHVGAANGYNIRIDPGVFTRFGDYQYQLTARGYGGPKQATVTVSVLQ